MKRLAFLLRPSWLALAAVVALFAYLCFTVLAPWQLGKNARVSKENDQISASMTADPVPVATLLPHQHSTATDHEWSRVTATGHYLPGKQALARLRMVQGATVFEVVAPFAVDGGPTVLVDRGWVAPQAGSRPPEIDAPPSGTVTLAARLRDGETAPPDKAPFVADGAQQVYAIDPGQLSSLLGVPLAGSYLQLAADQPGGLGVLELPHLDSGPFLSYGIQWIAFGIVAPLGLGYFAWSEIQARRRERAAAEALSAGEPAGEDTPEPQAQPAPRAPSVEQKLTDRYGRRR